MTQEGRKKPKLNPQTLNPQVPIPKVTQEGRKKLTKQANTIGENAKVVGVWGLGLSFYRFRQGDEESNQCFWRAREGVSGVEFREESV